jgi:hypothetical protein
MVLGRLNEGDFGGGGAAPQNRGHCDAGGAAPDDKDLMMFPVCHWWFAPDLLSSARKRGACSARLKVGSIQSLQHILKIRYVIGKQR